MLDMIAYIIGISFIVIMSVVLICAMFVWALDRISRSLNITKLFFEFLLDRRQKKKKEQKSK